MLLGIILALTLGITAGIVTGLIPGIHINLIGALLISASTTILFKIPIIYMIVFIVAMAITHTFLDFIPSIFLGCPDTDTELSVLPGHELLKKGQGYEAILLSAYGSLSAIIIFLFAAGPSIFIMKKIFPIIQTVIPYLLILASLSLIILEKNKLNAFIVFALTGFLGWSIIDLTINQPLFPLLTGLFGASILIESIKNKTKVPEQKIEKIKPKLFKPLLGAFIASPLCSFLPGLGSGQAAVLGNLISRQGRKGFLILLGATNTFVMGFSFISLYAISRTRTGAALAIKELIYNPPLNILILILIVVLITGIVSFYLTKYFGRLFSTKINKIDYTKLSLATIIILIILVGIVSGWLGILVLAISTITGLYCISLKVRRTNMMGCLLLPTILFYLI